MFPPALLCALLFVLYGEAREILLWVETRAVVLILFLLENSLLNTERGGYMFFLRNFKVLIVLLLVCSLNV